MDSHRRRCPEKWVLLLVVGASIALGLWSHAAASDVEDSSRSSRPPRSSAKATGTKPSPDDQRAELVRLDEKLDRVLTNQERILKKFDEVLEELRIVKVRATLRGGGT